MSEKKNKEVYGRPYEIADAGDLIEKIYHDIKVYRDIKKSKHRTQTAEKELEHRIQKADVESRGGTFKTVVAELEKRLIIDALEKTYWIQTRAAKELGISRRIIRYKMGKYGIQKP